MLLMLLLVPSLDINFLLDDGAVVYLNGVELFRQNMPGGTIGYLTTASRCCCRFK